MHCKNEDKHNEHTNISIIGNGLSCGGAVVPQLPFKCFTIINAFDGLINHLLPKVALFFSNFNVRITMALL